jgi:hypothetical protein
VTNDAKKAAAEADKLRLRLQWAQDKEGEPCRYNIIIFIKHLFSKAALPAPQELFVEALFALDANVIATPDTTAGVDPAQSVTIFGVIMECKPSVDGRSYRVRADDSR